jgi:hypothetical protein
MRILYALLKAREHQEPSEGGHGLP